MFPFITHLGYRRRAGWLAVPRGLSTTSRVPMPCPDCPKSNTVGNLVQLSLMPEEQEQITGAAAPFAQLVRRCIRCGLVYVRSSPPHRLGWLNGIKGPGFHPAPDYA